MTLENLQKELATIKGGTYYKIEYQSIKDNGYKKITKTTVRNISYASVKPSDTPSKPNPNDNHLGQNIVLNTKTGKARLMVFLTNHHKPHTTYYDNNGVEITREQWLVANPKEVNKAKPTLMFSILVDNILKVGA